jgi:AcrR family transcriptional regulator
VTDAILDATIALAAEGGLEDLTLDAIALKAGVGRPTIYRRWSTKEALLDEAMDLFIERMIVVPKPGNIRDELVEWISVQIERMESPLRSLWFAYFNAADANIARNALQRGHDIEADIIRRAIERGELRADADPDLLVYIIGAVVWFQSSVYHRDLDKSFAESVVDVVLNSWLASPGPTTAKNRTKATAVTKADGAARSSKPRKNRTKATAVTKADGAARSSKPRKNRTKATAVTKADGAARTASLDGAENRNVVY